MDVFAQLILFCLSFLILPEDIFIVILEREGDGETQTAM